MVPFQGIFVHFPGGVGGELFFFGFWYCKKVSSISSILVFIQGRTSHKLTTKVKLSKGRQKRRRSGEQKKGVSGVVRHHCAAEKRMSNLVFDQINATNCMLRKSCFSLAWDHWLNSHPAFVCFGGQWMVHKWRIFRRKVVWTLIFLAKIVARSTLAKYDSFLWWTTTP